MVYFTEIQLDETQLHTLRQPVCGCFYYKKGPSMVKQIISIYKIMLTDYKCKSLLKYTAWPTDIVI